MDAVSGGGEGAMRTHSSLSLIYMSHLFLPNKIITGYFSGNKTKLIVLFCFLRNVSDSINLNFNVPGVILP